ncbi:flagellar biosynthetic protein FliR, partial [Spirochaetota bacterium]
MIKYFVYHFQVFLIIMVRMSAMFVVAPFFSSGVIPNKLKLLLAFLITLVIFPFILSKGYPVPGNMGEYAVLIGQE